MTTKSNSPTSIKHTLLKPIPFGEDFIKEITLHEPTYKVLKSCNLSDGQSTINTIIEECNNLPDGLIDLMSGKDYLALVTKVSDSDFLG